jgi:hypothetical protein
VIVDPSAFGIERVTTDDNDLVFVLGIRVWSVFSASAFEHILDAFVNPIRCTAQPEIWGCQNGFTRTFRLLLSEEDPEFPKIYLDFCVEHMYDHMYELVFCACH